jgi:hypothetical protein
LTIRETIIAAVLARLAAIPGLAALEFMPSAPPSEFPAIAVDDFGQTRDETDATQSTYTMTLSLEAFVQVPGGAANGGALAHAQAMQLYASAVTAVMATPDRLGEAGDVVQSVEEGPLQIEVSALAATRTLSFTLSFDIQFINRSHDPSLA